jgi:hypothetical protein
MSPDFEHPPVISGEAKNLVVPGRAEAMVPPPLSFRSVARNLAFHGQSPPLTNGLRSLPAVEMTAGAGRRDRVKKGEKVVHKERSREDKGKTYEVHQSIASPPAFGLLLHELQ